MPSDAVLGATSLVITQGVIAANSFLPSLSEIRRCNPAQDTELAADVRMGETASAVLIMGVSLLASNLSHDVLPLYSGILLSILLVLLYESTLSGHKFSHKARNLYSVPFAGA